MINFNQNNANNSLKEYHLNHTDPSNKTEKNQLKRMDRLNRKLERFSENPIRKQSLINKINNLINKLAASGAVSVSTNQTTQIQLTPEQPANGKTPIPVSLDDIMPSIPLPETWQPSHGAKPMPMIMDGPAHEWATMPIPTPPAMERPSESGFIKTPINGEYKPTTLDTEAYFNLPIIGHTPERTTPLAQDQSWIESNAQLFNHRDITSLKEAIETTNPSTIKETILSQLKNDNYELAVDLYSALEEPSYPTNRSLLPSAHLTDFINYIERLDPNALQTALLNHL